jgi:hypothetical protein
MPSFSSLFTRFFAGGPWVTCALPSESVPSCEYAVWLSKEPGEAVHEQKIQASQPPVAPHSWYNVLEDDAPEAEEDVVDSIVPFWCPTCVYTIPFK